MARKRSKVFLLAFCFLIVTPVFSVDFAHVHRLRRDADHDDSKDDNKSSSSSSRSSSSNNNNNRRRRGPQFSQSEFSEKLKELLERDRPDRRDGSDDTWNLDPDQNGFRVFLTQLAQLADRSPDDLVDFDADDILGRVSKPGPRKKAQNNRCLKNPVRLLSFLTEVRRAMSDLRDEDDPTHEDTPENDSHDHASQDPHHDDNAKKSTQENPSSSSTDDKGEDDVTGGSDVTPGDDVTNDNDDDDDDDAVLKDDATASSALVPSGVTDNATARSDEMKGDDDGDGDDDASVSDEDELEGIDMEDVFEKLSANSLECVSAFLDEDDTKALCYQFSHQSARVFSEFLHTGADCSDYLEDGDDLDAAHQKALLSQLLLKPVQGWTRQDVRHAIRLAPDVIDDHFLEGFPEDILEENLDLFGSVASRWRGNAKFQLEYRRRITKDNPANFNASAITNLGKGLLALTIKELSGFNPQALLNAKIDDIFKDNDDDEDDDYDKDDDEDKYEDDERAVRRLALGRRMKEAGSSQPRALGKVVRFLYDDLDFLNKANPDQLFESMSEISDLDLDMDDASSLFQRVSQSGSFPLPAQFTRQTMQKVRSVLPGMGLSKLRQLPKEVVLESLDDLKEVHFGESEARALMDDFFEKAGDLTADKVQKMGRLARGLDVQDIEDMDDNLIPQVLDDMDHLDLSDAQKRLIAYKALKAERKRGTLRLLQLPRFAETVSVIDIGDLSDDEVADTLNVTSKINWRPSQAATILSKVKNTLGGRALRTADLPAMGRLVQGLLPGELQAMLDRQDDVDDLANVLGNQHRHLTSAQIDKLVELIDDKDFKDDSPHHLVTPDLVAQKGIFLAYLRPELWDKLEFDDKGLENFLSILSKMNTRKLPRGHLAMVAKRLLPIIPVEDDTSPSDADDLKIQQLGEFMLGLSPGHIQDLDPTAVLNNLPTLGTLPFSRSQSLAILGKVAEAEPEWKCQSTVLANLGPLLQFAPENVFDDLCDSELASSVSILEKRMERRTERVEERREEGLWREDSEDPPGSLTSIRSPPTELDTPDDATEDDAGRKRLAKRLLAAALAPNVVAAGGSHHRTRRAVAAAAAASGGSSGEKPLTCSTLRVLRKDVVHVPVSKIVSMEDSQFQDCLEVLGSASDWSIDDLNILFQHFTQVYGPTSNWTNEIIRQAGVLLSALPAAQFQELNVKGVDALNSMGRHRWLNSAQLQAGFSRWLELRNISIDKITFGEFSAMSEFVCGLTAQQIQHMPIDVFIRSLDVIGRARSCNDKQRQAYAVRATKAFGDVMLNWEPAIVRDAGHILGALTPPGIQQLTAEQIALISPSTMTVLPVSFIRAMTDSQLRQLSTNQVNALTVEHFHALSAQRRDILSEKATVPLPHLTPGTHHPTGAAEILRWSMTSLLAAIFVAFVVC